MNPHPYVYEDLDFFAYNMCMDRYIHSRTCVYNINYHIVWSVKYRRTVLSPPIAAFLKNLLVEVGSKNGFDVVSCEIGNGDYVHCFVSAPPMLSITQIAKSLKGVSGRKLFLEYPELRKSLWHGQLWNNSYFVETIGSTSEENVRNYIARQKICQM